MRPGLFVSTMFALALMSCAATYPKDLELQSVRAVDARKQGELPAPPRAKGGPLQDWHLDFLLDLVESKKGQRIQPGDVTPYFRQYENDPAKIGAKPNKTVLRVEFSSTVNLSEYAVKKGQEPSSHPYFCSRPASRVRLGWPRVYIQGLLLSSIFDYDVETTSGSFTYYVFLEISDMPSPGSSYEPFDLASTPEPICLEVRVGSMGAGTKSNVLEIPVDAIRSALIRDN